MYNLWNMDHKNTSKNPHLSGIDLYLQRFGTDSDVKNLSYDRKVELLIFVADQYFTEMCDFDDLIDAGHYISLSLVNKNGSKQLYSDLADVCERLADIPYYLDTYPEKAEKFKQDLLLELHDFCERHRNTKQFLFEKRLHCEDRDTNYSAFVSRLLALIETSLKCVGNVGFAQGAELFMDGFVEFFPGDTSLRLERVSQECFSGKRSEDLSAIYSELMKLWLEIDKNNISALFDPTSFMTQKYFVECLDLQKNKLNDLIKFIEKQ